MSQIFLGGGGGGGSSSNGVLTINGISPDVNGEFGINAGTGISITPGTNEITIASTGSSLPASLNTYYVDKNGNDSNSGESLAEAFLTFGAAITAANAQSPKWGVQCLDFGTYTEDLTIPGGVNIYAPNASLSGSITFSGTGSTNTLEFNTIFTSGTSITVSNSTSVYLKWNTLFATATAFSAVTGVIAYVNCYSMAASTNAINLTSGGQINVYAGLVSGAIVNNLGSVNIFCNQQTGNISGTTEQVNIVTSNSISQMASMTMDNSGYITTNNTAANTYTLGAYDTDNSTRRTFMTFTAGAAPTLAINNPSGAGTSTMDGLVINQTTRANAQFYTPVNAQTGTTYTLVSNDCGKLITASNSSAQTYTLPQQSTLTTVTGFWCWIRNIGTGTVTLVKEGSETLTGNTILAPGAQAYIYRNTTTNWAVFGGTATVNMPGYNTLIQTVSNVTYTLVGYAGNAGTILGLYQKARALTTAGTFNIQINGVNVTGLTSVVPSTAGSYTAATAANTFARGDQITIVYTGTSAVLDHTITLDFTQAF